MAALDFREELHTRSFDSIAPDATGDRWTFALDIIGNKRLAQRSHCQFYPIDAAPYRLAVFGSDDGAVETVGPPGQQPQLIGQRIAGLIEHRAVIEHERLIAAKDNMPGPTL